MVFFVGVCLEEKNENVQVEKMNIQSGKQNRNSLSLQCATTKVQWSKGEGRGWGAINTSCDKAIERGMKVA